MAKTRLRDLGVAIGTLPTGNHNAITDVAGVRVGHSTIIEGDGPMRPGEGPIRTGVTVILPNGGNIFHERVMGGGFVLNGAGELAGLTQVMEWGLIETPIGLTNTHSMGNCADALVEYMVDQHPGIGGEHDVVIPLVGECDDSWLNDVAGRHVDSRHVHAALADASGGPVEEGSVGGGTGMITCDLKAGIGTSSRLVPLGDETLVVGVLVMSNFGTIEQLRIDGRPFGRHIAARLPGLSTGRVSYGSIISVVAVDAPLMPQQLSRLAKRSALGIGRVGSTANHGSGEIVLAFTTRNSVPRDTTALTHTMQFILDSHINLLYQATADATEEAILNSLCAAEPMTGRDGHRAEALPLDMLVEYLRHEQRP